jgi:hypothetical protein
VYQTTPVLTKPSLIPPPYDHEVFVNTLIGYAAVEWDADAGPVPKAPDKPQIYATLVAAPNAAWLTDPGRPGNHYIMNCLTPHPEKEFKANAGTFYPVGKRNPVIVTTIRSNWTGTLEWITKNTSEASMCMRIITPGGSLLFRTGALYGSIHEYVQPMDIQVSPLDVQFLRHRRWSAPLVVTDAPIGDRALDYNGTYLTLKTEFAAKEPPPPAHYIDIPRVFLNYTDLSHYDKTGDDI